MKTTRREFLKWSGVGALGTVVFVGCGIPEEELQIQSASKLPEDLVSGLEAWYATSCVHCGMGEGIIVRVVEGRALKIEGNPDHPVSRGKTTVRCQAGVQALYSPDRLTGPMRRQGGEFVSISWDDALSELTSALAGAGSSVVMVTDPMRGTLGVVTDRFMGALGGRRMVHEPMENTVLRTTVKQVFGQDILPKFDLANADYVLNFGADFLSTWLSPVSYSQAYGEFRQGGEHRGTFVQVEPRMSMTAANADRWLYVTPGMEGTVAMSIAYVLMAEHGNEIDSAAANALTGGGGAAALAAFAPESVTGATGVSAERIRELATELAEHNRSLVLGGGSAAAHTNGQFNMSAIYSLNWLVGNVGREGGVLFNPGSPLPELAGADAGASFQEWETLAQEMHDGNVNVLLVHGANPAYGLPDSVDFAGAMERVGKVVSFSSFMDETTAKADLVLPDQVYLESWGDDVPEPGPGYQTITFQQPVVYPFQSGTRAFGDVVLEVAQRLGSDLPWATMKDALQATAQRLQAFGRGSVSSGSFDAFWNAILQRGGWWDINARTATPAPTPPRLPTERLAPTIDGPTGGETFNLLPFSSISLGDGKGANLPWLQATPDPLTTAAWHTWAEINPQVARDMDIKEGDVLELEGPGGRSIKVLAYPHPAAAPGVISVPTGQGHTIYGDYEIGPDMYRAKVAAGRGSNVLSMLSPLKDRETGALAWAATRVSVKKTGDFVRLSKLEGVVLPILPEEIIPIAGLE